MRTDSFALPADVAAAEQNMKVRGPLLMSSVFPLRVREFAELSQFASASECSAPEEA